MNETEIREIIHDINNSLTTVLGAAELIGAEADPESQVSQDAQDIADAALRGRDQVNRLREALGLS